MVLTTYSTGQVLSDRYRLLNPLGGGASGHVFLADDLRLERRVAVKVLLPELAADSGFLRRFWEEARAAASLNHPHVVRVFDWGEDAAGPYLVLELLGGGSLARMLADGTRMSAAQATRVGMEAAQGLAYVHSRGIVHRDVKPANLLFDEEGRVRVGDFGVARARARSAWTEPAGAVVGTPRYLAPEQARGDPVDGRSDVYALGLVLFEAVTGALPADAGPRSTDALGPLEELLRRATDPLPENRPEALGMAADLASLGATLDPPAALPLPALADWEGPEGAGPAPADVTDMAGLLPSDSTATHHAYRTQVAYSPQAAPNPQVYPQAGEPPARTPRPRRQTLPWVLAAVSLAALLAAGVFYAIREKLFIPSHGVPTLSNMTVAEARHAVAPDAFRVRTDSERYSTSVPDGRIISQDPAPAKVEKEGTVISVVVSKGLPQETVPDLTGADCSVAQRMLGLVDLSSSCPASVQFNATVPKGEVVSYSYNGKNHPTTAPWHSTISIVISGGPPPVTVPQLVGATYAAASRTLSSDGLKVTEQHQSSSQYPSGEVISSNPAAGQQVASGSTVTLTVSSGPPTPPAPKGQGGTKGSGGGSGSTGGNSNANGSGTSSSSGSSGSTGGSPTTTAPAGSTPSGGSLSGPGSH